MQAMKRPDALVDDLIAYLGAGVTPRHSVAETARRLRGAGFRQIDEHVRWSLRPNGRYFTIRGGGSLVAWRVAAQSSAVPRFRAVAAHTDSPTLRLKPELVRREKGQQVLDLQVYGSPLLHTWLDRDLSVAGAVVTSTKGGLRTRLVRHSGPLCRIPSLAIHLHPELRLRGLRVQPDRHLGAIFGAGPRRAAALSGLMRALGLRRIPASHELVLFDAQPAQRVGLGGRLVTGARIDNLAMCHAGLTALLASVARPYHQVLALFDHEEVGNRSDRGAGGTFLPSVFRRITKGDPRRMTGLLASADMAHGRHPGHETRSDRRHTPLLNRGTVIKTSARLSYGSGLRAAALFRARCKARGIPVQEFVTRPGRTCGRTLGPVLAARLGAEVVDVGSPMLSMHSCRETCGARDHAWTTQALAEFLTTG